MAERKKTTYFSEVKSELQKVTWTTKKDLILCTKVVVLSTFLFGFAIYLVDVCVHSALQGAGLLIRALFG